MLASLLPINFLLIFLVLRKFQDIDWRGSLMFAAVIWGLLLTTITESFSHLKWLYLGPVAGVWGLISLALLLLFGITPNQKRSFYENPGISNLPRSEILLLALPCLIVIWLAVLAWAAPPNTWDSMTYHMSRVMHWIQNRSVAFYPTYFLPQLHQNPWSEFAILHFQILSGGDRFANFVQWSGMAGSLIGVSLIAKELNASSRGQILSAVICATIPMGILQGSSTQTDYVCSFWLVCFVYFGILFGKRGDSVFLIGASIALGLGILTKATAYIFAFPFAIWFFLLLIKSRKAKEVRLIFIPVIIVIAINLGHYSRNYELYGNPLGPLQEEGGIKYVNEHINISTIASNLVRNIGLHLATPIEQSNVFFEKLIASLHETIGISPNDEGTTMQGNKFHIPRISVSEDSTGNLVHVLLILVSIYLYLFKQDKEKNINYYLASWLCGALLFSAILRWQPWNSRLQLPFFVLGSPFIGLVLSRIRNYKISNINYASTAITLLFITSLPWMLMSFTKPVFRYDLDIFTENRIDQYFATLKFIEAPYIQAAKTLKELNCSNVGVIVDRNSIFFEYPFWVLLQNEQPGNAISMRNVNVRNVSRHIYHKEQHIPPCAVVMVDSNAPSALQSNNTTYVRKWGSDVISVLAEK